MAKSKQVQELEAQLAATQEKLAEKTVELTVEQRVNQRMKELVGKEQVQQKAVQKRADSITRNLGDTFNNETIVNFATVGQVKPTPNNKGMMVMYNLETAIDSRKGFYLFTSNNKMKHVVAGKKFPVTEHLSKNSGKTSYAIYLKGKAAAVYGAKKK